MKNKVSKFKCGDIVKVILGTKDPDFNIDIGEWSGKIEDVELIDNKTWLYFIIWDETTLKKMSKKLIKKCEKENLDFEKMYLEEKDLEVKM